MCCFSLEQSVPVLFLCHCDFTFSPLSDYEYIGLRKVVKVGELIYRFVNKEIALAV